MAQLGVNKIFHVAYWPPRQVGPKAVGRPPHRHYLMENFVRTHQAVCDMVGVKLAPETDKEKAFFCETSGTVLGVIYDTVMWSVVMEPRN